MDPRPDDRRPDRPRRSAVTRPSARVSRPLTARFAAASSAVLTLAAVACLSGCSLSTEPVAASTPHTASPSPTAFNPLSGPTEAAAQLPTSCSGLLSETDLTTAFGATQSGDDVFGSYAALPSIGRTGRVTCQFGIGIDMYGNPTPPVLTVAMITYTTPQLALSRVNATTSADAAAGALTEPTSVSGHPATLVFETPTVASGTATTSESAGTGSATDTATDSTNPAQPSSAPASPPAPPADTTTDTAGATDTFTGAASASPSTTPSASGGQTELFMADGNRTFSLQIPWAQLSGSPAVTALVALAVQLYADTLPPSPKHSGTAKATASSGS